MILECSQRQELLFKTNKNQKDGKQSTAFRITYIQNCQGPVQSENVKSFIQKLLRIREEH